MQTEEWLQKTINLWDDIHDCDHFRQI